MPNTWPFGLTDKPSVDGFREIPAQNIIRTQMDAGPTSIRRYQSTSTKKFDVQFELATADVATFETFYVTTLSEGSDTFQWNEPRTGTAYNWQFASDPIITALGGDNWLLTCTLERLTAV